VKIGENGAQKSESWIILIIMAAADQAMLDQAMLDAESPHVGLLSHVNMALAVHVCSLILSGCVKSLTTITEKEKAHRAQLEGVFA